MGGNGAFNGILFKVRRLFFKWAQGNIIQHQKDISEHSEHFSLEELEKV